VRPHKFPCASDEFQNFNSKFRPWLVANTRYRATRVMQSARPVSHPCPSGTNDRAGALVETLGLHGTIGAPTGAPNHHPNPLSFSAVSNQGPGPEAKSVARKRCRRRVRVEGLYLEREPAPELHAQALLKLIQDECPEKVGSFIPRSHLDRAYRELCAQQGWKALSWVAIGRALGKLTRRRLLKRNGVRFVAYRLD